MRERERKRERKKEREKERERKKIYRKRGEKKARNCMTRTEERKMQFANRMVFWHGLDNSLTVSESNTERNDNRNLRRSERSQLLNQCRSCNQDKGQLVPTIGYGHC